ncbi:hypothetical protein B0T09DRAFT_145872 [Sordaria sp. MPI-SDFR-AT-0083]|nr:hypothetical protein B0T09DRAFT_145872 [Sordaria sp. MPI-SDFR-AT-0083]
MLCIQYQVGSWPSSSTIHLYAGRLHPQYAFQTIPPSTVLDQGTYVNGIGLAWLVYDGYATQPESRRFPGRLKRSLMQRRRLWLPLLNTIGDLLGPSPLRQAGSSVSSLGWPNIEHQTRPILFVLLLWPDQQHLPSARVPSIPSHLPVLRIPRWASASTVPSSHLAEAMFVSSLHMPCLVVALVWGPGHDEEPHIGTSTWAICARSQHRICVGGWIHF